MTGLCVAGLCVAGLCMAGLCVAGLCATGLCCSATVLCGVTTVQRHRANKSPGLRIRHRSPFWFGALPFGILKHGRTKDDQGVPHHQRDDNLLRARRVNVHCPPRSKSCVSCCVSCCADCCVDCCTTHCVHCCVDCCWMFHAKPSLAPICTDPALAGET